jgi:hypothetical protein
MRRKIMDPVQVLQLISLAIQVFGEGAQIVQEIKSQAGMSDEQLLAQAEQSDQETRDLIAKHLEAVKAQGGNPA